MKNIFRILMAAAVLLTASCAKEEISSTIGGGEVEVTFTANLAGLGTRAIADGNTVDCVYLAIFDANNDAYLQDLTKAEGYPVSNGLATIPVVLLKDKKYDLVFWAQKDGTGAYTLDLENRQVTANYDAAANNEARDAFFNISNDWTAGKDNTTFELRRPFAQINVGNSDADVKYAKQNGSEIKQSAMTVTTKVYDTIELVNGSLTGTEVSAEFTLAAIPTETVKGTVDPTHDAVLNASEEYNYLAMNYLLVNDRQLVDLVFNFTDGATTFVRKYFQVPVQRNYRTNILGQIISSPMDFTVEIKPGFDGEHTVDVWDGKSIAEPAKVDGKYVIVKPSELAWLAAAVNGTITRATEDPRSFQGETFILNDNIDLGGHAWTPIGNSTNQFKGTFDGNGKVITNLYINTPSQSNVGLFGMTTVGEIKNLTVKDAKVTGRLNVGVVAGNPYTSKYTNITVTGHIEVNGMAYVGGVGGKNAYANWNNITVEADKTSYVKANSIENGTAYRTYVGGVVGFNGEGGHSFTNIKSNINVEGTTIDVGGLFGIAHYGNKFENCSCSGNVKITDAAEAADAEEMGGIAGVWNNGGSDVVMTNCTFTGSLSANVEFTPWYSGLVGKPYSESGSGKLIIDGIVMTGNGVGEKEDETNVYYITSAEGLKWVEAQEDNYFAGKTIKLANDIDMAGVNIEKPIHFWSGRTTFDGQNYTISNLTMTTTSTEKKPFGLFGGTADIKNVKFDKANISGYSYVAVVAGNLYGNIENCHVANSTVTCTYWMAGAMSGQYNAGNVTNCSVKNTTVTGPAAVGALVGNINETAGERKVENCIVEGCTVAQNSSFGGDYDLMFASAVGLININNSTVHFNNVTVADTKVKGAESTLLFGRNGGDNTTVYVDGKEYVTDGVTKANDNYYIYNAAGLKWVADTVNATTPYTPSIFDNVTVYLANDIDLNNEEWIPIGDDRSQRTEFHGTFDGQGYTVSNVKITKKTDRDDENKSSYGLFGNVKATVKNLTVKNVNISGTPKFIGALVGRLNGGLIENCHVLNSNVTCENWTIGGLVGQLNDGNILRCSVEKTTITGYAAAGAIVGIALNNGERNIKNCIVKDCNIVKNGSFGGNFDNMFGAVIGALYNGNLTVNCLNSIIANTTVLGEVSNTICGFVSEGDILNTGKPTEAANADALVAALESGQDVVLTDDVKINPAGMSNAYGTTGINVKNGQTIDGGGHILDIKGAGGTWDSGISTTGGLIKNITVTGSFRGVFVNHNSENKSPVYLENVIIEGTTYTISCDQGSKNGLYAINSTFKGWTSYAATLGNAKFTNCYFGEGAGYAFFRPYAPTEFVGCEFEAGFQMDARAAVTFENCTLGGVAITAENVATLVTYNTANATVK